MSTMTIRTLCLGAAAAMLAVPALSQDKDAVVGPGKAVEIELTMSLEDGTVVNSNVGGAPMHYVHGEGQLFPRLEDELAGMRVDEKKTVVLEAEDAYGPTDPAAIRQIPMEDVPEEGREVGAQLIVEGVDWPVFVRAVTRDGVVLDFNHPLAGRALRFDVRILSVT